MVLGNYFVYYCPRICQVNLSEIFFALSIQLGTTIFAVFFHIILNSVIFITNEGYK